MGVEVTHGRRPMKAGFGQTLTDDAPPVGDASSTLPVFRPRAETRPAGVGTTAPPRAFRCAVERGR